MILYKCFVAESAEVLDNSVEPLRDEALRQVNVWRKSHPTGTILSLTEKAFRTRYFEDGPSWVALSLFVDEPDGPMEEGV